MDTIEFPFPQLPWLNWSEALPDYTERMKAISDEVRYLFALMGDAS